MDNEIKSKIEFQLNAIKYESEPVYGDGFTQSILLFLGELTIVLTG